MRLISFGLAETVFVSSCSLLKRETRESSLEKSLHFLFSSSCTGNLWSLGLPCWHNTAASQEKGGFALYLRSYVKFSVWTFLFLFFSSLLFWPTCCTYLYNLLCPKSILVRTSTGYALNLLLSTHQRNRKFFLNECVQPVCLCRLKLRSSTGLEWLIVEKRHRCCLVQSQVLWNNCENYSWRTHAGRDAQE